MQTVNSGKKPPWMPSGYNGNGNVLRSGQCSTIKLLLVVKETGASFRVSADCHSKVLNPVGAMDKLISPGLGISNFPTILSLAGRILGQATSGNFIDFFTTPRIFYVARKFADFTKSPDLNCTPITWQRWHLFSSSAKRGFFVPGPPLSCWHQDERFRSSQKVPGK